MLQSVFENVLSTLYQYANCTFDATLGIYSTVHLLRVSTATHHYPRRIRKCVLHTVYNVIEFPFHAFCLVLHYRVGAAASCECLPRASLPHSNRNMRTTPCLVWRMGLHG